MTGRTHDLAAITALGYITIMFPIAPMSLGTAFLAVLANQIGGIAPDIDQPTAPLWRNLPIGGFVGRRVDELLGGHRFLTHSLAGAALFSYGFYWILKFIHPLMMTVNMHIVWWAFVIGILSHLVMDSFTKEGVPWLLPIPIKFGIPPWKSGRITTGKFIELWIIFPGLIIWNAYFGYAHYEQIRTLIHQRIR